MKNAVPRRRFYCEGGTEDCSEGSTEEGTFTRTPTLAKLYMRRAVSDRGICEALVEVIIERR